MGWYFDSSSSFLSSDNKPNYFKPSSSLKINFSSEPIPLKHFIVSLLYITLPIHWMTSPAMLSMFSWCCLICFLVKHSRGSSLKRKAHDLTAQSFQPHGLALQGSFCLNTQPTIFVWPYLDPEISKGEQEASGQEIWLGLLMVHCQLWSPWLPLVFLFLDSERTCQAKGLSLGTLFR